MISLTRIFSKVKKPLNNNNFYLKKNGMSMKNKHFHLKRWYSSSERRMINSIIEFKNAEAFPPKDEKELSYLLTENQWRMKITSTGVELERNSSPEEIVHVEIFGDSNESGFDSIKNDMIDEETEENVEVDDSLDHDDGEYFVVKIKKPSLTKSELHFNCSSRDGSLHVNEVIVMNGEKERRFSFYDLNEDLQDDIEKYLLDKGINSDFADIVDLSLDKYDSQYSTEFAEMIEDFLSK